MPVHDPTDADYILTAVLLASHLGGSSADIQAWSGGFKEGVPHNRSGTRAQLEGAFKLREGPQMGRVVTVAERLLGVEFGELAVSTYCLQINLGKYQKKVPKRGNLTRMLSGDPAHFAHICHHVAQLSNADLGHLAGKGGRYCKAADRISMPGSTPRPSNLANMLFIPRSLSLPNLQIPSWFRNLAPHVALPGARAPARTTWSTLHRASRGQVAMYTCDGRRFPLCCGRGCSG